MSFNPAKDGSKIWEYMHIMAANAITPRKRELYVQWLNSLQETFPCDICRVHLITNLEELPVETHSNTNVSLFFHSWKLHDTVNKQLHKSQNRCLTYEQAFEKYFGKPQVLNANAASVAEVEQPRHVTSASKQESPQKCTACQAGAHENTKQTFDQYRAQQRKVFTAKN